MEPEVHIIEKYFQVVQCCFTMTNIQLKGKKEIDLLAINPKTSERFHIESRVSTSFKLRLKATYTKGKCTRDGVDYFDREKFNHPTVFQRIHEIFHSTEYRKILVVWDVQEESVIEQAKKIYGIEVCLLHRLIMELIDFAKRTKGSRDDILRTMEFIALGLQIKLRKRRLHEKVS